MASYCSIAVKMRTLGRATASCLWLAAIGCAPAREPGVSDGWGAESAGAMPVPEANRPPAPRLVAIPPERRVRWEHAEERLRDLPARGPSEHGDGLERTVAINEAAAPYEKLGSAPFPAGALIVQRHHRPSTSAVVSSYVMLKSTAESWEFAVLDAQQRVAARGRLAPCERCHLEAAFDSLFGPPRAEPP